MTTDLKDRPVLDDAGTSHALVAHIVRRDDQMRGYIEGAPIRALCGIEWVPCRDPDGLPVCDACLQALAQIRASGGN